MSQVPDARRLEAEVGITRQQRLTCCRMLPIQRPDGTSTNLLCRESYRHVGSRFVTGNRLMPEVRTKMNAIDLRGSGYILKAACNPLCPKHVRLCTAKAYLLSKGFSCAGVWPHLPKNEYHVVSARVYKVFRAFLISWFCTPSCPLGHLGARCCNFSSCTEPRHLFPQRSGCAFVDCLSRWETPRITSSP